MADFFAVLMFDVALVCFIYLFYDAIKELRKK